MSRSAGLPLVLLTCAGLAGVALTASSMRAQPPSAAEQKVDFRKDVQPILQAHCHKCHSSEKHRGDLRLDSKAGALEGGLSGKAIVPGDSSKSLLVQHVLGINDRDRMPPEPADPLSAEQIGILRAWIDAGADWPDEVSGQQRDPRLDHWAYQAPKRPEPPQVKNTSWVKNPIDSFILARLEREGLSPSPEADKVTLIRRASLDLIGLPPTLKEVDDFLADSSPDAYEKLIERLLASPHYGEHQARYWLDAARYADTNGYEKDRPREMWRYRDWVINAFNANMPFSQFTIEQMAGDMLPEATEAQRIATGFHRNTMFNEEGGIDVEEYRYRSIVDRVETTGTVFLGMTLACAQCHNHKYDPISQKEYFQFFSILNNQDEPVIEVPTQEQIEAKRRIEEQIAAIEARYADEFPLPDEALEWRPLDPASALSVAGATLTRRDDFSLLAGGARPDKDTYTIVANTDLRNIVAVRVEVMTDSTLPRMGPGRADNGNLVLSELSLKVAPKSKPGEAAAVELWNPRADWAQPNFPVSQVLDGNGDTGWAIDPGQGQPNRTRTATFELKSPVDGAGGSVLTFTLAQNNGGFHTIGRLRLWAGGLRTPGADPAETVKALRREHLAASRAAWEARMSASGAEWHTLEPVKFSAEKKNVIMEKLDDRSILVTGDRPTRDTYEVEYETDREYITAIRLETLTDPRLPFRGPGRGSGLGDGSFMLTELTAVAIPRGGKDEQGVPVKFKTGVADFEGSFAGLHHPAQAAIDGNRDSGWSIIGGQGRDHVAIFTLEKPVGFPGGTRLKLSLLQNFIDQHTIGRFRVSVTSKPERVQLTGLPAEVEAILALPPEWRNSQQRERLERQFLSMTPELKARHEQVAALRAQIPKPTTALVLQERTRHPRTTRIHIRGEFLAEGETVTAGVPIALPPLPKDVPPDRLTLAKWIVSASNPLTARVQVNRLWYRYFGRGIVNTIDDFGMRAEKPSHPELLDWLATEFVRSGWDMKAMHRLMLTSATYRQSSHVTPEMLQRDPYNILLARGPRGRVEAEVVRDIALRASGLLVDQIGGPSVYPPLPPGVGATSYGGFSWPTSTGPDRYRRGVYTFWKRSLPYPSMITFDAPTRESVCVRRGQSNTPLQALTLMNDEAFIEAARSLARRVMTEGGGDLTARMTYAFRLCVARAPDARELERLTQLFNRQLERFQKGEADAAKVALPDPKSVPAGMDLPQLAAWTMVSDVLLNLDETITKG